MGVGSFLRMRSTCKRLRVCDHLHPYTAKVMTHGGAAPVMLQVYMGTGVPHLHDHAPHQDPAVGLCLGSYGGPRALGAFLWAGCPYTPRIRKCPTLGPCSRLTPIDSGSGRAREPPGSDFERETTVGIWALRAPKWMYLRGLTESALDAS